MAKITVVPNGPFIVEQVSSVVDAEGRAFDLAGRPKIALCRCAASKKKPFCDGAHRACQFASDDVAPRVA